MNRDPKPDVEKLSSRLAHNVIGSRSANEAPTDKSNRKLMSGCAG
jgi:hypothetical protein